MLAAYPLAHGETGTKQTVAVIRELVRDGRMNSVVRRTAEEVLRASGIAERDALGEIRALFEFVRSSLRYTRDPINVEQVTTAEGLILDHSHGDCDDFVVLLGSLLEAVGHPVRLKIVRKAERGPWRHIYLEVFVSGRWLPADPTNKKQPLGWEVQHGDAFVVPIDGGTDDDLGWAWVVPLITTAVSAFAGMSAQKKQEKAAKKAQKEQQKFEEKQLKKQFEAAQRLQTQASLPKSLQPTPAGSAASPASFSTTSAATSLTSNPLVWIGAGALLAAVFARKGKR